MTCTITSAKILNIFQSYCVYGYQLEILNLKGRVVIEIKSKETSSYVTNIAITHHPCSIV